MGVSRPERDSALRLLQDFELTAGGKSALLTAITIALGGKAAITGRGNGLKDLIRKGCE
jgi:hypothetical protein